MSNRDKFLLVIIGIAGVILLPYFLYIKDARDRIMNLDNEIVQLNARYEQLLSYEVNREFYIENTEANNKKRDEIIDTFPSDIQQSNYVMYLLNTEYSEYVLETNQDEDETVEDDMLITTIEPTIRFTDGKFTNNIETPISSSSVDMSTVQIEGLPSDEGAAEGETAEGNEATSAPQIAEGEIVETEYVALQNNSTITFTCYDQVAVNHLLEYIMEYEDPMIYREITFDYDKDTGRVKGEMLLAQYAVLGGENREFEKLEILPAIEERGNEHYGIFGPNAMLIKKEIAEALEAEANGEIPEEDEEDNEEED